MADYAFANAPCEIEAWRITMPNLWPPAELRKNGGHGARCARAHPIRRSNGVLELRFWL